MEPESSAKCLIKECLIASSHIHLLKSYTCSFLNWILQGGHQ